MAAICCRSSSPVAVTRSGCTRTPSRNSFVPALPPAPARLSTTCAGAGPDFGRLLHPLASVDEDNPSPRLHYDGADSPREPLDRDDAKEAGRVQFRTVFDFPRWASHRSTARYSRHVMGMGQSRIVRGLAAPLLYETALAGAVALAHQVADASGAADAWAPLQLHSEPFALTSFALSLLLVFRTNASYARWLDARKTWGALVNRSRDLTRQGLTWLPEEAAGGAGALRSMLCRWIVAFVRCLKCHLREGEELEAELATVLPPNELAALLASRHRPNYCLQVLSQIVREAGMTTSAALNMDMNLTSFEDCVGTCERILREPIPLSYTRHTSRFMIIWLSLLPFSLWESCHWAMVPVSTLVAFLLLGIEEIGVQIEEPFSILPLERMCDTIQANIAELQETHSGAGGGGGGGAVAAAALVRSAVAGGAEQLR